MISVFKKKLPFTTYLCDSGFSLNSTTKVKYINKLNVVANVIATTKCRFLDICVHQNRLIDLLSSKNIAIVNLNL